VERLQLVSGQLPQPDPGEHRPADLHRSRDRSRLPTRAIPGHHVYNALLEQHLVRDRGWVEFSVYALFSPQSLIAEGTANYGIEVAFPGDERLAFERDVLFPLAGLDGSQAAAYAKIRALVDRLSYAGNEAARHYLNGERTRTQTVDWLDALRDVAAGGRRERTRFFDTYRSYVINYNLGQGSGEAVRGIEEFPAASSSERRWQEFVRLLASPRLPSALRTDGAAAALIAAVCPERRAPRRVRRDRRLPFRSTAPRPASIAGAASSMRAAGDGRNLPYFPATDSTASGSTAIPRRSRGSDTSRRSTRWICPPTAFRPASSIALPWETASMEASDLQRGAAFFSADAAHFGRHGRRDVLRVLRAPDGLVLRAARVEQSGSKR